MAPALCTPAPIATAEAEHLALEAAVTEARTSGSGIPHAVVRRRMLAMVAEARQRTEALAARHAGHPNPAQPDRV